MGCKLGLMASFELPRRAEIEAAALRAYELLNARNQVIARETEPQREARVEKADSDYWKAAADLSRMLLGPAASMLGAKRRLVVADGGSAIHTVCGAPCAAAARWKRSSVGSPAPPTDRRA